MEKVKLIQAGVVRQKLKVLPYGNLDSLVVLDPEFPAAHRLHDTARRLWVESEVDAYIGRKLERLKMKEAAE